MATSGINPAIGLQPEQITFRCIARAAITQGEVVVLDLGNADGDVLILLYLATRNTAEIPL